VEDHESVTGEDVRSKLEDDAEADGKDVELLDVRLVEVDERFLDL